MGNTASSPEKKSALEGTGICCDDSRKDKLFDNQAASKELAQYKWMEAPPNMQTGNDRQTAAQDDDTADTVVHVDARMKDLNSPVRNVKLNRKLSPKPGMLTGVGILLIQLPGDNQFRVAGLDPAGPAARSGQLTAGDLIIAVNGQSTAGKRQDDVMRMLLGHPLTEVELTIAQGSQEDIDKIFPSKPPEDEEDQNDSEIHFFVNSVPGQRSLNVQRQGAPGVDGMAGIGIEIDKQAPTDLWMISDIDPRGPLGADGRVTKGELLLAVGGKPVIHLSGQQVMGLIKGAPGSSVQLTLSVPKDARSTRDQYAVRRVRGPPGSRVGLGFTFERQKEGTDKIMRVTRISEHAQTRDRVRVGDILVEIDGQPLQAKPIQEISEMMRGEPESEVLVTVERDHLSRLMLDGVVESSLRGSTRQPPEAPECAQS